MNAPTRLAGLLLGSLLMCSGMTSVFAADNVIKPTRGTIDSVNDSSVQITTRQGEKLDVKLTDQTKINAVTKGQISDIKADSFIGTAAVPQANGTLKALEVHVFAPSLRGSGEGFNPFESADGKINTMTNGTVGKLVNSNGRTLTVKYHDAEKTVIVPDDVPVVLLAPGDRSLLKPGTKIVLFAMKDDKGALVARGIAAGKDGIAPPM
ncbi:MULTISPECIES: hypothetical protein [Rahnella]|jgi:hypothetical protein|uniref:hypothetical protein n=1 Tax=Rahnella TaxID=34037 RepID=UPI000E64A4D0|nr:hypothetical protein [Rahnella sp. CG8]AYA06324.1 hypothetical protein D3Z09_07065 [Rahnella aquatilis]AZP50374.1 hypothetical protein EJP80_07550 [Rahnella aquatilis]MCM2444134.1 hypothetical protein [Rahnella sp. CG8]